MAPADHDSGQTFQQQLAGEGMMRDTKDAIGKVDEVQALTGNAKPAPDREPMLQFFQYGHLPPRLALSSAPFCDLAHEVVRSYPRNPERTVALRKLLEAKDAAVRCMLYQP